MSSWLLKWRIDAWGFAHCLPNTAYVVLRVCGLPERFSSSALPVLSNLFTRSRKMAPVGAGFLNFRSKRRCTCCWLNPRNRAETTAALSSEHRSSLGRNKQKRSKNSRKWIENLDHFEQKTSVLLSYMCRPLSKLFRLSIDHVSVTKAVQHTGTV
jgi:hypothetical protein